MAVKSIITGDHLANDETIISAYRTKYSIRIFFESNKGLREIKQHLGSLFGEELIAKQLTEKDPNDGASKNSRYFANLEQRALRKKTKSLPSQEAEMLLQSLISAKARLFHHQWRFVSDQFDQMAAPVQIQDNYDETSRLIPVA